MDRSLRRELKSIFGNSNYWFNTSKFKNAVEIKIKSNNDVKYTKNNNGIFLNMKLINDNCLKEILDYLVFIKNNKIL